MGSPVLLPAQAVERALEDIGGRHAVDDGRAARARGVLVDEAARDRGPSPTPAAFAACVNHKLGDRVIVKTAAGKSLNGTCRKYQDKLAARTHIRHKKDKGWWKTLTSWI